MNAKPMGTRRATTNETGQVLALFALFLVVFLGFTALTIDYGSWLKARRDYQNAADSAVLAGSAFLSRPINDTKQAQAREAAWESLKQQLGLSLALSSSLWNSSTPADDPVTDSGYRLWVSTPPIEATTKYPGGYTGDTDRYLFAWVEKENPSFFARIFGQGDATVSAWATAGQFPSRFAVITLRQPGQDGPANATDIDLAGSNSALEVIDGDVGGNWGMKLNSSSQLWLHGLSDNEADVYLQTYTTCGQSCWSPNQINSGLNGNPPNVMKTPLEIPFILDDPNYPLPSVLTGLPVTGGTAAVPKAGGTEIGPPTSKIGDLTLSKGTRSGVGCDADSPRIGPGWYHDLRINECVVLDPIHNYSDPDDSNNDGDFGQTNVPASQQPGIFYITGNLDVQAGALLVGDGVTIVLRPPGASLQPSGSGAVIDLNTGASDGVAGGAPNQKKAAYMTDGNYTYGFDSGLGRWVYNSSLNTDSTRTGVAIYVAKPSQYGVSASDANTDVIKVNALAGLAWSGITYAPHDNIDIAGQPDHDGIGQFVSWTFKFAGNTVVKQTYDGPDQSIPHLVEPHLGQ